MHKTLHLLSFFLFAGLSVQADNISNWQVYLGEQLVLASNEVAAAAELPVLRLSLEDLRTAKELEVRFHTCTVYLRKKQLTVELKKGRRIASPLKEDAGRSPMFFRTSWLRRLAGGGSFIVTYHEDPDGNDRENWEQQLFVLEVME